MSLAKHTVHLFTKHLLQSDVLVNIVSPDMQLKTIVSQSFLKAGGQDLQDVMYYILTFFTEKKRQF